MEQQERKWNDKVRNEQDLIFVVNVVFDIFEKQNIATDRLDRVKVVFGRVAFLGDDVPAYYEKPKIVVARGNSNLKTVIDIAHEYGHHITLFGNMGHKSNLINELSAYNFQRNFTRTLEGIANLSIKRTSTKTFIQRIKEHPIHTIAGIFSFIPIGIVKETYKRQKCLIQG